MTTLPTLAAGVLDAINSSNVALGGGTEPALQEIASADDGTYVFDNANTTHVSSAVFALEDMPTDFANMNTLAVRIRYHKNVHSNVNSWNTLTVQVYQSDLTTALTNERTIASNISTTTPTVTGPFAFTGVNTTANKALWDGAVVVIRISITKSMGGDTDEERVTAIELTGDYTADVAASLDQVAYRGYDDDAGLGSATAKAAQNTNWNQPMEENFRVRFEIQEGMAEAETVGFQLQYNLNSAGWNNVHALSLAVRASPSSNVADGAATGDLLTAGTGTFRAGTFDEVDGQVATVAFSGSDHTEVEFCVKIRSTEVAVNDTIQLRVIRIGGSLETWTATPTITATAVNLSFAWADAIHPPENSHIPPIKVGSDYYAIAVDSTATSHFGIFKTTTPNTPASWTWVAGSFAPEPIGAIAWELISTTVHVVTKDASNAGFVNYWAFTPSGDSLGTREEVTSAPQDSTGPTLAAVSFAFLDEPQAGYSANWGGSPTAFEWKHRDTPVGGQWMGFEDFISDTSETALAGRLISTGATMFALWVDSDIEAGARVAWASTDNLFDWTAPTALTAVPSTAALHVLSNAVIFGAEDDIGVAFLDSSDQLSFVGLGSSPELITTSTPMISSSTLSVSLVVDASGNVHALIVLADGSVQHSVRTGTDTWSSLTQVLAAGSADTIHAAWIGTLIAYTYDDGTGPVYGEYTPAAGPVEIDGTVAVTASITSDAEVDIPADAAVVATASITSDAEVDTPADAAVAATASITVDASIDTPAIEIEAEVDVVAAISPTALADTPADAAVAITASITADASVDTPAEAAVAATASITADASVAGGFADIYEDWSGYPDSTLGNPTALDGKRRWRQGANQTVDLSKAGWRIRDGEAYAGSGFTTAAGIPTDSVSATSSSISSARCETDLGSANMYVRATFGTLVGAPAGTGFGVFGRVGDADSLTCYYLQIRQANNQVNLLPITDGAFGTGIGTVSHTYSPGDVFELRCFGTTISVRINDVEVISVTNSTVTSGSKAGLFANTVATNSGVRCTAWQAGLLDGSGNPVEGTPEDPIPMVLWATQVAAGTTTARISCQARNADLVRIVVADNSGLTSPVFTSSYVAPDSLELVSFEVTGLTAGTDYFYGLQVADATVDGVRNLRTAPSGQTSFIVAMSGDAGDISTSNGYPLSIKTSNSPTYARIADRDPAFFLFAGDRHYRDYNLANIPAHLLALRDTFNNPRLAGLAEQVPVMQIWDDHDYTGISDSTATGRDAAVELFRTAVPTDAWLVDTAITDPVGYTFAWGRTRWIILDHRSSRSSGNILGTAQLNAVLDLIENATEELIVLYVGVPWIAGSAPLADHWGAFTANRATIAEKIEDFAKGRVLIVHADSHMLAIDDGTNTQYDTGTTDPGPPLLCAAPVDSGSSIKGGPYSEGTVPSSAGVLVQQYATIEIDDQGSHLVVTLRGWQLDGNGIDETEVLTYEFTVGEPAASAAVDVVATISAEASTVASTTADVDVVATITAEAAVEGAEPPARTLKFVTPVVAGVRGGW